jgi:hypothetical protein
LLAIGRVVVGEGDTRLVGVEEGHVAPVVLGPVERTVGVADERVRVAGVLGRAYAGGQGQLPDALKRRALDRVAAIGSALLA